MTWIMIIFALGGGATAVPHEYASLHACQSAAAYSRIIKPAGGSKTGPGLMVCVPAFSGEPNIPGEPQ